ncbi:PQQ-binding-like beta-propeller repeat protein [Elusimicrobiota bacterium]
MINRKNLIIPFLILSWVILLPTTALFGLDKEARDQDVDSRFLWKHEFPGSIEYLELTKNGYIHATSRIGTKRDAPRKRFLLDGSGKKFWEGDQFTTALLLDEPHPLIMAVKERNLELKSISKTGNINWTKDLEGFPASITGNTKLNVLILVMMDREWFAFPDKPHNAVIKALNVETGEEKWELPIGKIEFTVESAGGDITVRDDYFLFAGGGRALKADFASGKMAWDMEIPLVSRSAPVWQVKGDDAYFASGGSLMAFSLEKGFLWHMEIREGAFPTDAKITDKGFVAGFFKDNKMDVVLFDKNNGKVNWLQEFKHKTKKYGLPNFEFAISENNIYLLAGGTLRGLALDSGEEMMEKVKFKFVEFAGFKRVWQAKTQFSLVGESTLKTFSLRDGELLRERVGFVNPTQYKLKSQAMAVQLLASQGVATAGQGMRKKAGEYSVGSWNHTSLMQAAARADSAQLKKDHERRMKTYTKAAKAVRINIKQKNNRLDPKYERFYGNLTSKWKMTFNVAADVDGYIWDLESDKFVKHPAKRSNTGCSTILMMDPKSEMVIQAYMQMGLFCKDEHRIEAYKFPLEWQDGGK